MSLCSTLPSICRFHELTFDFSSLRQLASGALPDLTKEEIDSLVAAAKPAPQRAFMQHMDQDEEY